MRPYVRAANVGWGGLVLDDVKSMNFTDAEMTVYGLQPGDLLLNEASGAAREVGKPAIWCGEIADCAFQNTLLRVRPRGVDARYLLHYFKELASSGAFARQSRGVGIFHLGREALAAWPVPVLPIEEQRRIAAVLDQADELRARRQESLALLGSLNESIFLDMFGDRRRNRLRVPVVPLADLVDPSNPLARGIDQPGPNVEGGVPYIKTTDFGGRIHRSGLAQAAPTIAAKFPRSVVRFGDSVICIRATVGPAILVDEELSGVNLSRGTARVSPAADVESRYLLGCLQSCDFQNQIRERLRGATFLQIPLGELKQLEVLRPDRSAQREYARRVTAAEAIALSGDSHRESLDALFRSLQHRAFAGQL